jgi:hypothetical protein
VGLLVSLLASASFEHARAECAREQVAILLGQHLGAATNEFDAGVRPRLLGNLQELAAISVEERGLGRFDDLDEVVATVADHRSLERRVGEPALGWP